MAWHDQGLRTRAGDIPIIDHYLNCLRANDGNERIAIQLCAYAVGESSMGVGITDTVFIQDQNRHGRSILDRNGGDAKVTEVLRRSLAKNGYTLKADDHYIATAARPGMFGDPQAIISNTQTLGDMKRNLEKQGRTIEGEIQVKGRESAPKKPIRLNPRIVETIRQRKIREQPELARKDQRELREQIIATHGSRAK